MSRLVVVYLNDLHDPSESIYAQMRAKPHLYDIGRSLPEIQAHELLEREVSRFNEQKRAQLKEEMNAALGRLEPAIALLGTLLWGFADLLNRCPACH